VDDLRRRHPREQGDIGERAAVSWLWRAGAYVFIPFGHSPDYDLVADFGTGALRVEVKTSTSLARNGPGRYAVHLTTSGGNQSWNRIVKLFDPSRCDFVFILVADGRRWFIPTGAITGRRGIIVGGPKCAGFEVGDDDASADAARLLEWPTSSSGGCPSG
jgi:Holliday junction resolvase-like predicted endonuclease